MRHPYPTVTALAAAVLLLAAACSGGSSESSQVPMSGTPRPAAGDPGEAADGHDDTQGGAHDGAGSEAVEPPDGTRTVEVAMSEFAFEPATIDVTAGEPTLFVFHNEGAVEHEAMLGDAHMQEEFGDGHGSHEGGHHGDLQAVTVPAGEARELLVTFEESETVYFGCHLPGHYDAGMEATVNVT